MPKDEWRTSTMRAKYGISGGHSYSRRTWENPELADIGAVVLKPKRPKTTAKKASAKVGKKKKRVKSTLTFDDHVRMLGLDREQFPQDLDGDRLYHVSRWKGFHHR